MDREREREVWWRRKATDDMRRKKGRRILDRKDYKASVALDKGKTPTPTWNLADHIGILYLASYLLCLSFSSYINIWLTFVNACWYWRFLKA